MKKENLKVGNVIETREGKKYIIGLDHSRENKVARYLNDESMTFEYFNHLDEMCNDDLKAADDGVTRLDIVRVYEDMCSLIDDDIAPIWERSRLDDLEYNSPILVKDNDDKYFMIKFFKGIRDGHVVASATRESSFNSAYTWDQYKLLDEYGE